MEDNSKHVYTLSSFRKYSNVLCLRIAHSIILGEGKKNLSSTVSVVPSNFMLHFNFIESLFHFLNIILLLISKCNSIVLYFSY